MKKVAVLFGGKSVEHEVSIITGMQVMENMDKSKYEPIPIYITKEGKWLSHPEFTDFKVFKNKETEKGMEVFFRPGMGNTLYTEQISSGGLFGKKGKELTPYETIDIVFPALHGTFGEDGSVQGYLDLIDLPYVGCGVLAASVGMDKILMKEAFRGLDIPLLPYTWCFRSTWETNKEEIKKDIEKLGYPVFVKPSNLGSSIGITKVNKTEELEEAMELAMSYDRKVIIEKGAKNPRELNMAVLGYEDHMETSEVEEPELAKDLLDYESKYMSGNKNKGKQKRKIPADVPEQIVKEMEKYAILAMKAIDGMGTARIDFLLEEEKLYVNEINTLPGSIAFYLWEGKGLEMKDLITKLLEGAEERSKQRKNTMYHYDVNLLELTTYGSKL
ncbi:MAG: D-alanine--D-alanine ligase family protein [Tissierellia bacterium]|nr:D-alanine--D-alanine ligase family protein [Tissierellia bacterium]